MFTLDTGFEATVRKTRNRLISGGFDLASVRSDRCDQHDLHQG